MVYMFVCDECKHVCRCVHTCGGERRPLNFLLYHFLFIPLRHDISLKLELGWKPISLSDPPVPTSVVVGLQTYV